MSQRTKLLVLFGCALVLGGFVLGIVPVESAGSDCGPSFASDRGFSDALVGSVGCSEVRSAHLPWAWSMITMGVVVAVGAVVLDRSERNAVAAPKPAEQ
ncbi:MULTISPECIES: hypothetical protein [unclassified Nocardiopsis]|uniref:hypothetical protein n=1 Tax=unclassified Nocardiopsis TaxID=2649073 RepID=UPI00116133E4|nr:hypothetical protein [Nocardiopsis sp. TSRI0078]